MAPCVHSSIIRSVNHVSSTAWQKRAMCQKLDAAERVDAQTCSQYMLHSTTAPPQLPAAIQLHTLGTGTVRCIERSIGAISHCEGGPPPTPPHAPPPPSRLCGSPAGHLGLGHTWQPPPSAAAVLPRFPPLHGSSVHPARRGVRLAQGWAQQMRH